MNFGAPGFLPLLAIPGVLLLLWFWQVWRRRADARAFLQGRRVPVHERVPFFGELLFWFFLLAAATSAILALARPTAVTSLIRTAGVDLVILQDGSSSMHVTDVRGNRWQRSMRFLRTLGESQSFQGLLRSGEFLHRTLKLLFQVLQLSVRYVKATLCIG